MSWPPISRDNLRASEAGLKYFVLGALSSGMLLYGVSLMYGYSGTVSFAGVAAALKGPSPIGVVFALVFVLAGLAFKISAVPFHMWTPDVYEGAPTPVTTFFASAPKMAAMAVLVRVTHDGLSRHRRRMAADHRLHLDRLDGARRLRRDRPDQHQAADGLFVDRPHGLRAGRPRRRHGRGRAWRRHLHGDLSRDDAGHLRRHPVDAARRRLCREHLRSRRASRAPTRRWRSSSPR